MAPPLPNSAHTETSSYLRNLAVPRGLNLSARNRSKEPFVVFPASRIGCHEGRWRREVRILPPTDLHKRLKTARYRGVHVRG